MKLLRFISSLTFTLYLRKSRFLASFSTRNPLVIDSMVVVIGSGTLVVIGSGGIARQIFLDHAPQIIANSGNTLLKNFLGKSQEPYCRKVGVLSAYVPYSPFGCAPGSGLQKCFESIMRLDLRVLALFFLYILLILTK